MWLHESVLTGFTLYGLLVLFIKALVIVQIAYVLADDFEFGAASVRHSVWLIALLSLGLLPILMVLLPSWHLSFISIDLPQASQAQSGEVLSTAPLQAAAVLSLSFLDWLIVGYLAVAIPRCLLLIREIVTVGSITMRASEAGSEWYAMARSHYQGRRLSIKVSGRVSTAVTWGTLYPYIILPEHCQQWSSMERDMVLQHEIGHIKRRDWLYQLFSQLVCILYWPVPGIGRALAGLSLEAERACDDCVLADGAGAADYAALLVRQAQTNTLPATVALGKPSELSLRVRHIVNVYADRVGERRTRCLLYVTATAFMIPFATLQAVASIPFTHSVQLIELLGDSDKAELPVFTYPEPSPIEKPYKPQSPGSEPATQAVDSRLHLSGGTLHSAMTVTVLNPLEWNARPLVIDEAELQSSAVPEYPQAAQRRGIQGRVVVQFDVDRRGQVINATIASSSSPLFNRSVLTAINAYRYSPYRVDGEAIALQGMQEQFNFRLVKQLKPGAVRAEQPRASPPGSINSG